MLRGGAEALGMPEGLANCATGGVGTEEEWATSMEASEGSANNAMGDVGLQDIADVAA